MSEMKKVVVVDDDRKIIILLEKALTEKGFQVFSAVEGTKALELVKKERPALLISDILQPGIDGISLCQEVKQDPELGDIAVILMTGVYKQASFKTEMNCKPDAFIEKPLDINQLKAMILEELGIGN